MMKTKRKYYYFYYRGEREYVCFNQNAMNYIICSYRTKDIHIARPKRKKIVKKERRVNKKHISPLLNAISILV